MPSRLEGLRDKKIFKNHKFHIREACLEFVMLTPETSTYASFDVPVYFTAVTLTGN